MAPSEQTIAVLYIVSEGVSAVSRANRLEQHDEALAVEHTTSIDAAMDALRTRDFDCVVGSHDPPSVDGLAVFDEVRTLTDCPFVLDARVWDEDLVDAAIAAGVSEYHLRHSDADDPGLLASRIEHAVSTHRTDSRAPESDRRFLELTETTNDVLWMFSADWEALLFVNSAYEDIWGRSMETLAESPRDWMEGVAPADRDRVRDAMERLAAGESVDLEYRVNAAEDFTRWVWVQGEPVTDESGEVVRIAGFARDVTDRKEREQELERYETIVENTEDGVYVFDEECRFTFVNQRVVDVSGIPHEAWVGEHVSILEALDTLSRDEVEQIEAGIDDIFRGERDVVRLDLSPDVPSDLRHLELRLTPLRGAEGPDRVIGFSRDITERVDRERELEDKNDRLEEFASIVSHDLRNPLNVADGSLELGRTEADNEHFQRVARALDRMDSLIDDLLTMARSGERVSDPEPVALDAIIPACWQTVETEGTTLSVAPEVPTISADRNGLRQLLENLFRNALEHSASVERVSVGPLPDGNGFYVEDDGSGIPESDRETVFESGFSTMAEGTGLGLTIVAEIAEAHGWVVTVTASDDGGARFEFRGVEVADADSSSE